ncbi:MAG: hypothetical protein IH987_11765 [Planctomycetes bacterium]|nr:hypothetical protein [Planctomycetota bacterium]
MIGETRKAQRPGVTISGGQLESSLGSIGRFVKTESEKEADLAEKQQLATYIDGFNLYFALRKNRIRMYYLLTLLILRVAMDKVHRADHTWNVRLIEKDFHRLMLDVEDA